MLAVRASDDDFIVIRFLVSQSGTTGTGEDLIVILLLASGYRRFSQFLLGRTCHSFLSTITLSLSNYVADDWFLTSLRRWRRSALCDVALRLASTLLRHWSECACSLSTLDCVAPWTRQCGTVGLNVLLGDSSSWHSNTVRWH